MCSHTPIQQHRLVLGQSSQALGQQNSSISLFDSGLICVRARGYSVDYLIVQGDMGIEAVT